MSFLRSLKLSGSVTARALTIPSRIRSWISRSRSGGTSSEARPRTVRSFWSAIGLRRSSGRAPCLATVPPGDRDAEPDVQPAEGEREDRVVPCGRRDEGGDAEQDEAESHDGNDPNGER